VPDLSLETAAGAPSLRVAGVDEVGRGPLAGPVVAAAVILPASGLPGGLAGAIDDSKALSAARRPGLATAIAEHAAVGLGRATVEEIDVLNILRASFLAMTRALAALDVAPAVALIDGNRVPADLPCRAVAVVRGDRLSLSIAAASIVAKVARDTEMRRLAAEFPGYGWERNAGYGTAEHRAALARLGPCDHHRRSFAPVSQALAITR